jgi:N-methylhydantoinase A
VRLVSWTETPKPRFATRAAATARRPAPATTRRANLGRGFEPVAIHHSAALAPGDVVESPAIVEEAYTTIAVYPGWRASLDDAGDWVLTRSA